MKIDAITIRELQIPLVDFFETSFGRISSRCILLVTAHCDGVDGWGECVADEGPFYSSEWSETAWATIKKYLAPAVLNRELASASEIGSLMARIRGHRRRGDPHRRQREDGQGQQHPVAQGRDDVPILDPVQRRAGAFPRSARSAQLR